MSKKLYVGNIAFQTTNDDLVTAFSQYGTVTSAEVITDRETGRSRGFAFDEMSDGAGLPYAKFGDSAALKVGQLV
ncbi:MAG TPA: RNA-binding protein, partial [Fimbriiglobus sp.]|nr:RNA-binding protein [Fimbriiglobus sp.]